MKQFFVKLMVICVAVGLISPTASFAYNFGDFRSETLVGKAWEALKQNDVEAVLAYTNKCVELYGEQAKKMQDSLKEYPDSKDKEKVFANWALNDVATALFIQGEVYRRAEMNEEAKKVYQKLMNDYTFGQTWDKGGWFWKPAEAAKEKMNMLDSGSVLDFGDYSSAFLVGQAWRALPDNPATAILYVDKVLELYKDKAKEMQNNLTEYPWQSKEVIFNYWGLNDVGTGLFIKGEANKKLGNNAEAAKAYKMLIDEYFYAQCWDPQGWFWKPAEAAQEALDSLGEI